MPFIALNGRVHPAAGPLLPADTRAFRQGFALVETMLMRNGQLPLAALHFRRLFAGMEVLGIARPRHFTEANLEKVILALAAKNSDQALCRVRLQLWPGSGGLYDAFPAVPDYLIETFRLEEHATAWNENGLVAGIAEGLAKSMDATANLKTANALIYALAARQARANGWNDALLRNSAGSIIESTIANIFWVKAGMVYTPPLADGCIAGVARALLLETILPSAGIPVSEAALTDGTLHAAEELFLTNAVRGVRWIARFGTATYSNTTTKEISRLYQQML